MPSPTRLVQLFKRHFECFKNELGLIRDEEKPRFPGFKVRPDIISTARAAAELMKRGKVADANLKIAAALDGLRRSQVSFFQGSPAHFLKEVGMMQDRGFDEDLVGYVRKRYEALVAYAHSQQEIELQVASNLYRDVEDALNAVHEQQGRRDARRGLDGRRLSGETQGKTREELDNERDEVAREAQRKADARRAAELQSVGDAALADLEEILS